MEKVARLIPPGAGAWRGGGFAKLRARHRPRRPLHAGFTWSDVKATVAAISFIIASAVKYAVDHDVLNSELQQLGLPRENSDGISRPFRIHRDRLTAEAVARVLHLPGIASLRYVSEAIVGTHAMSHKGLVAAGLASADATRVVHFVVQPATLVAASDTNVLAGGAGEGAAGGGRALTPASPGAIAARRSGLDGATAAALASGAGFAPVLAAVTAAAPAGGIDRHALVAMEALAALGSTPLGDNVGLMASADGSAAPVASTTPTAGGGGAAPRAISFSAGGPQVRSLLAELRTAHAVMTAVNGALGLAGAAAASAPAAAPSPATATAAVAGAGATGGARGGAAAVAVSGRR